ncbi:MAG: hypothetical protein WCK47_07345 [bacterium]
MPCFASTAIGAENRLYSPDLPALKAVGAAAAPADTNSARAILSRAGQPLSYGDLASLLKAVLLPSGAGVASIVCECSARLRRKLFGIAVITMAPVEIANTCLSDCLFCGWRRSNQIMKRLAIPDDLAMLQVEYLVGLGIHHIEFVSGDDIKAVRESLPRLIAQTRELFRRRGIDGIISFCTLALTERQYRDLKSAGADAMILWQETYDRRVFKQHIKGGPKASGIDDDWKQVRGGDGCRFRIESQERALRAGLDVALGSMLGLNPDICADFLAAVDHARYLAAHYDITPEHPMIIGMPIWNPITTHATDLRPARAPGMETIFPAIAGLYMLALPRRSVWIFPNCRVSMDQQIEAARVAGVFTSTEVKLGPGGYLPSILKNIRHGNSGTEALWRRAADLVKQAVESEEELARVLDEHEQFVHHYHTHEAYLRAMERAGLRLAARASLPATDD